MIEDTPIDWKVFLLLIEGVFFVSLVSLGFSLVSLGFSLVYLGFSLVFHWFFHGFPCFPWFSLVFLGFHWFSMVSPCFSLFSLGFIGFPWFPLVWRCPLPQNKSTPPTPSIKPETFLPIVPRGTPD